jgi:hypothetical protein
MSVQNTHTGGTTGASSHNQTNSTSFHGDSGTEVGRMNKSSGSTGAMSGHGSTGYSTTTHGYATNGSTGTFSATHGGSAYGGTSSSAHSMTSSSGGAPYKPVPCTTGYVNGVCGSGATTGGNHGPGLPGGACPSGQVRGPSGCTGPRTGTGSSTSPGFGSTSHFGPGNQRGGATTLPVPGHGSGAQPMISHSQYSQASHFQSTQPSYSQGSQFLRSQGSQFSRPQNPPPSHSSGAAPSNHRR